MYNASKKIIPISLFILLVFGLLAAIARFFFPEVMESTFFLSAISISCMLLFALCIYTLFLTFFGVVELKEQNDAEDCDLQDYLYIISPATTFFSNRRELERLLYSTMLTENFDRKAVKQLKTINDDLVDIEEKIATNKDRQADLEYRAKYLSMLYHATRLLQSEYDRIYETTEAEDTANEQNTGEKDCLSWRVSMTEDMPER